MHADTRKSLYNSISEYYKELLGEKTFKIPVSIVDTCPNRMGLKKMETCIFCDDWGSAAYKDSFEMDLRQQIEKYQQSLGDRYNSKQFLVYFQAYTNSLAGVQKLKSYYDIALSYPFVKGIVVGTRPDCISPALLRLWAEYSEKTYFSVELGVQSFFEKHVRFLKRGHLASKSIEAVFKIKEACPKIDIGLHFIFGLPEETEEHIIESAKICNSLPIGNIKLHNLHVLKNTGLEILYNEGNFEPISLHAYAEKCRIFLDHLSPDIYVHRLGALASRWNELISPDWCKFKMKTYQAVLDHIQEHHSYQGKLYIERPNYALTSFPIHLHN